MHEDLEHRVLRLSCGPEGALFEGFKHTLVTIALGKDGKPQDEEAVEKALLDVLTDARPVVHVCRMLGSN
jgi:hypothetical protein